MQAYKSFTISGSAVPDKPTGFTWKALGSALILVHRKNF
jgi:hypothetical protein